MFRERHAIERREFHAEAADAVDLVVGATGKACQSCGLRRGREHEHPPLDTWRRLADDVRDALVVRDNAPNSSSNVATYFDGLQFRLDEEQRPPALAFCAAAVAPPNFFGWGNAITKRRSDHATNRHAPGAP